jgi:ketosteroid isomerase-like protein
MRNRPNDDNQGSCQRPSPQTSSANEFRTGQTHQQKFGQGDLEAAMAVSCFAGDVAIQHPMPKENWPRCGRSPGRRALANFLSEMSRVLSFEVFEAREFIAQGDKVVVNVFERPRVKATGKVFDNDYVHIYTVRDGLIAEVKIFEDTAMVQAALRPD